MKRTVFKYEENNLIKKERLILSWLFFLFAAVTLVKALFCGYSTSGHFVLLILSVFVLHELLHVFGYLVFCGVPIKSIRFGFSGFASLFISSVSRKLIKIEMFKLATLLPVIIPLATIVICMIRYSDDMFFLSLAALYGSAADVVKYIALKEYPAGALLDGQKNIILMPVKRR